MRLLWENISQAHCTIKSSSWCSLTFVLKVNNWTAFHPVPKKKTIRLSYRRTWDLLDWFGLAEGRGLGGWPGWRTWAASLPHDDRRNQVFFKSGLMESCLFLKGRAYKVQKGKSCSISPFLSFFLPSLPSSFWTLLYNKDPLLSTPLPFLPSFPIPFLLFLPPSPFFSLSTPLSLFFLAFLVYVGVFQPSIWGRLAKQSTTELHV